MSGRVGSIVIPAYNEGGGIGRCLDRVFDEFEAGEVEVVVACNGCTDDTAAQARGSGHPVTVIELAEASKIGALRAAERIVSALPRLYLDADVNVSGRVLRRVLEATMSRAVAARPPIVFDLAPCNPLVRRYYRARQELPGVMSELWGSGSYALSARARARFDEFPDVIADDLYAARIVGADEIEIVEGEPVLVNVPRTIRALVGTLKRVYRGNRELADKHPEIRKHTTTSTGRQLFGLARRRGHLLDAATYACVVLSARLAIRLERQPTRWERDETSREQG